MAPWNKKKRREKATGEQNSQPVFRSFRHLLLLRTVSTADGSSVSCVLECRIRTETPCRVHCFRRAYSATVIDVQAPSAASRKS